MVPLRTVILLPVHVLLVTAAPGLRHSVSNLRAAFGDFARVLTYFLNFTINCWLALRPQGTAFAGLVGVSLTYAFTVTQSLNWTVRMISQLQMQMVSVERIQTYTEMPTEAALESSAALKPSLEWPTAGAISFNRVDLRYRHGLPRVLRGLTFSVNPKEKVGIVGRTGAGKSSLIVALMRLVELDAGSITIDGVDIGKIGLHDLRANIAIIPQDPVLFSGTVRSNLDPFDQFSDEQLWTSVKRASLQKAVSSLDDAVDEKGPNFSTESSSHSSMLSARTTRVRRPGQAILENDFTFSPASQSCVHLHPMSLVREALMCKWRQKSFTAVWLSTR